jgi:hypothetical protein
MAANLLGLAKTMRQLQRIPSKLAPALADQYNAFLQAGFDAGTDPYGNPWAPLRPATLARGRFPPPLTDKGPLRANAKLVPSAGSGLELIAQVPYGFIHMSGAPERNLVKRRYFPDSGLPAAWKRALEDELHNQVDEVFNG